MSLFLVMQACLHCYSPVEIRVWSSATGEVCLGIALKKLGSGKCRPHLQIDAMATVRSFARSNIEDRNKCGRSPLLSYFAMLQRISEKHLSVNRPAFAKQIGRSRQRCMRMLSSRSEK